MKRNVTKWSGVVVLTVGALVLTGCGDGSQADGGAADEGGPAVIAAGGGDYRDYQEDFNVPTMETCADSLIWDYTEDDAKMTKVTTEAGGEGTLDVVELPNDRMQQLVAADAMLELDADMVPNIANVRDGLENPYWVPHVYSASVIIYNEDQVTSGTESYEVLWDPAYEGRIGVLSSQWSNFFYAAAAVVTDGQDNTDWDAGWEKLQELEDSVVVFASQEELGQALMSEQVWLTVNWKSRALQWNALGDVPLGTSVAEEGTFPIVFTAGVPKNAPNKECALEFLNALLDPGGQTEFALNMGYSPTVTDAEVPEERAAELDFTEDEQARIVELDLDLLVENDARWGELWQQEFIN